MLAAKFWMVHYSNQTLRMCSVPFRDPVPSLDDVPGALRQLQSQPVASRRAWDSKGKNSDLVAQVSGGKMLWLELNSRSVDL